MVKIQLIEDFNNKHIQSIRIIFSIFKNRLGSLRMNSGDLFAVSYF